MVTRGCKILTFSLPLCISTYLPWPGEFRIQDVITFTNWRADKGQNNAILLFYPHLPDREINKFSMRSSSIALGDDSIIPKGPTFIPPFGMKASYLADSPTHQTLNVHGPFGEG